MINNLVIRYIVIIFFRITHTMRIRLLTLLMCCFSFSGLYLPPSYSTCTHMQQLNTYTDYTQPFGAKMGKIIKESGQLPRNYQIKKVVLDPGHGGKDRGCKGEGTQEKVITLSIAKKLGRLIKSVYPNVEVIYTRDRDVFVELHKRAEIANSKEADLFISIHCNALSVPEVRGSETYVMGLHTAEENLDVAKRENASILMENNYQQAYGDYDPYSSEGHIFLSMYQNTYLEQSILLANSIERQIKKIGRKSRGVKQAGFVVLRQTAMPSVLVETGYLTNANDNTYLSSTSGQEQVAAAILKAFTAYKKEMETEAPVVAVSQKSMSSYSSSTTSSIYFRVQLASSASRLNTESSPWNKIANTIELSKEDNLYKYLTHSLTTYNEAQVLKQQLQAQGFPSAFVVAYEGAHRIPVKEAKDRLSQN